MDQRIEIRRKLVHLSLGVVLSGLIYFDIVGPFVLGIAMIVILMGQQIIFPAQDPLDSRQKLN